MDTVYYHVFAVTKPNGQTHMVFIEDAAFVASGNRVRDFIKPSDTPTFDFGCIEMSGQMGCRLAFDNMPDVLTGMM